VIESVMKAYFIDAKDISTDEVLVACAKEGGLKEDEAKSFLEGTRLKKETLDLAKKLQRGYRVTGVPYFVINEEIGFSGAQPPETFVESFKKLGFKTAEPKPEDTSKKEEEKSGAL